MTFTVASNSFNDGDYAGRNRSPHLKWSGCARRHKKLCRDLL